MTEPTRPPAHAESADEPPLQRMATQIDRETPDGAAFLNSLSDEDLSLFAEAVALQREMEEATAAAAADPGPQDVPGSEAPAPVPIEPARPVNEEPIAGVVPMRRSSRRISRVWTGLAAAAVIAAIAVPFLRRSGAGLGEPTEYVALLSDQGASLPQGIDTRSWGLGRGTGGTPDELRRAAQVGAYVVDLQIAIDNNDAVSVTTFAARVDKVLQGLGARGPVAARQFRELESNTDPRALRADFAAAVDAAEDAVDEDHYALGAWAETARVAALREDAAFFRSDGWRTSLDRAERTLEDGPEARAAIQRIRAATEAGPPAWPQLRSAIDDLFRAIA